MAVDLDDVNTQGRDNRPKISDLASVLKFPERKWVTIRLFGAVTPEAGYWIKTKKRDGGSTRFYTRCPSFDPATQERDSTKYDPWRDLQDKEKVMSEAGKLDKEDLNVQYAAAYWMQAIYRIEQKRKPASASRPTKAEKTTGFKDKDSDTWTPVQLVKLGKSLIGKIKELKGLNTVESSKTGAVKAYAVNDIRFGRDVRVFFDPSKAPADQYQVQLGEKRTPLTEEEQAYLTWDPAIISDVSFDDKTVKSEFEAWASRNGVKLSSKKAKQVEEEDDDAEDFDDEEEAPKKKSKAPAKKSKKPVDDDEDFDDEESDDEESDDDDEDDDFDDEEDEPAPKKKAKAAPAKKSKKPVDDDDDFDDEDTDDDEEDEESDDDEDDFDDEDDEPAPKKKAPAKSKSKKPVEDDDFDEDEDEEEAPKSKAKKPVKKAQKPVDDEDDDFGEDDDDEDDAPPPKSKSKAPAKKSKKPVDDDDFDDEDEESDEDDEDEEPAPKKKAKAKPAAKKSRRIVEDELDDDDIPF